MLQMATVTHTWILLSMFTFVCCFWGVQCLSFRARGHQDERGDVEALAQRRVHRGLESSQEHCALLTAPWMEINSHFANWSHLYRLKILPLSKEVRRRPVFPEQPLFRFVRRVYRCCQQDYHCGSVKGLQGRDLGGSNIEFVLSEDVMSATVARAEIHLSFSNPENVNIQPLLPSLQKRERPTRFRSWTGAGVVELRVDLAFVFQALQRVLGRSEGSPRVLSIRRAGRLSRPWTLEPQDNAAALRDAAPPAWGEGHRDERGEQLQAAAELGLTIQCSTAHTVTHPCENHGVRLLHTPFITLSYT